MSGLVSKDPFSWMCSLQIAVKIDELYQYLSHIPRSKSDVSTDTRDTITRSQDLQQESDFWLQLARRKERFPFIDRNIAWWLVTTNCGRQTADWFPRLICEHWVQGNTLVAGHSHQDQSNQSWTWLLHSQQVSLLCTTPQTGGSI